MKKILLAGVFAALGAGAAMADPVEGVWKTQVDDGAFAHVTIAPCGSEYCGVISRTFNSDGEYQSENIGRKIVWDMEVRGGGSYKGGQIWQPSTDKIYSSKMSLKGNVLKVSGCFGPICKKQTWNRVN